MPVSGTHYLLAVPRSLRVCVAWLLGRLSVAHDFREIQDRLAERSLADQAALISAVFGGLFFASLVFSHAGPGGLAAFWGSLIYILR